jgi:pyrimidine-nucleoside phosphorylase
MKKKIKKPTPSPSIFSAPLIIQKKRDKKILNKEEIEWFIKHVTEGTIPDYQCSALLMAIYLNGMTVEETKHLTNAMLYSGRVFDFKDQHFIDKHSTGGVGDKTSFILAPLARAMGVKVPMIAGRGLGHTGGTIDKVESIKGFKTELTLDEYQTLMDKHGLVLMGQTKDIAPADKLIYALRDVTSTVESIPLITASIMSKKLAEGAKGIVMDIKTGNGAFMSDPKKAKLLAKSIMDTGLRFEKNMQTFITDMSQPLGNMIGNSLEIIESIETLKGKGPKDLTDLSLELAGGMAYLAGITKSHKSGVAFAKKVLDNGEGLKWFRKMIEHQGGDGRIVDNYSLLPVAEVKTVVYSTKKNGYIHQLRCKEFGLHALSLGAGRTKASEPVDFSVGIILHKKVGDAVKLNEPILTIVHHTHQKDLVDSIKNALLDKDIVIKNSKPKKIKLIQSISTKFAPKKSQRTGKSQ